MKFATAYLENLYPNVCLRLSSKLTFFPRFVGEVHTYYLCSLDHRQSNNPCLTPTAHPLIACAIKTPWLVKGAKLRIYWVSWWRVQPCDHPNDLKLWSPPSHRLAGDN